MRLNILVILIALTLLAGCAGLKMKPVENQNLPSLSPDKSRVVFMRSSLHGIAVDASLYEIVDEKPNFIGVLANNNKMYIDASPGNHVFMSLGISPRFVIGDLQPGKTYYVVATPRGWPAINFSLYPFRTDGSGDFNMGTEEFNNIFNETVLVEMSPEALEWAEGRNEFANKQFGREWPAWKAKSDDFKANFTILPTDGT